MNLFECQRRARNTEDDYAIEFILHINGLRRKAAWIDPWRGFYRMEGEDRCRMVADAPKLKCERTKNWRKK